MPMTDPRALQPAALDPSRPLLASLELRLAEREKALAEVSAALRDLQAAYLDAVGGFYRELVELENAIFAAEVRAGLRRPAEPDDAAWGEDAADGRSAEAVGSGCSTRGAASNDLKAMFRNLAKSIHPDLALRLDEPERWRRHSLMAEANRAYAERDEDRLRLILHAWERAPESALDAAPEADDVRARRRMAYIDQRLAAIEAELGDLRTSAIGQLQRKIDDARAQGWDLLAEMILEVKREVRRAGARLASLRRTASA
jgi:hypothetical protein